jgi:hypothetical protein
MQEYMSGIIVLKCHKGIKMLLVAATIAPNSSTSLSTNLSVLAVTNQMTVKAVDI